MDSSFQFEVGVFPNGFTPTLGNMIDWDDLWFPAQETDYVESTSRFNAVFTVQNNEAPFEIGAQAWIYGRKITATGTERILFRSPDWTWPEPAFFNPDGPIWRVNDEENIQVVIGTVNPSGTPFLMQSELVRTYAQWVEFTMPDEPLNAPDDDPDGDGIPNFFEFVFGTNPLSASSRQTPVLDFFELDGEEFLQLSTTRIPTHLARLTAQVSTDLVQWDEGPEYTEVIEDSALNWIVRDRTSVSDAGDRRFIRLRASE